MKHAYILFWIFSAIFIIGGIYIACSNIIFYKNADIVNGTVLRYDKASRDGMYRAVYTYFVNGVKYEATSPEMSSSSPDNENIGKDFKIAVNKKDPTQAKLVPELIKEVLIFTPGTIIAGLMFFALAFFFSPYVDNKKLFSFAVNIIMFFVVIFVPVGLGATGTWLLYDNYKFFKNAVIIQGTVVGFKSHKSEDEKGKKRKMYAEKVAYTFNGIEGEIVSKSSSSHYDSHAIGQARKVGVDPRNPYDARIYSKWYPVIPSILIFISALLTYTFARLYLRKHKGII